MSRDQRNDELALKLVEFKYKRDRLNLNPSDFSRDLHKIMKSTGIDKQKLKAFLLPIINKGIEEVFD